MQLHAYANARHRSADFIFSDPIRFGSFHQVNKSQQQREHESEISAQRAILKPFLCLRSLRQEPQQLAVTIQTQYM
jgi:hypothetical protein